MKKQYSFIILFVVILGLSFSIYQYFNMLETDLASATTVIPNPGHTWTEMECNSSLLCIDTVNKKMDFDGNISATGTICVGSGSSQVCLTPITYANTCAAATGNGVTCTETIDGSYVINSFVLSGTETSTTLWTVPVGVTSIEYLVVGGGGAGGGYSSNSQNGGGGGAGGMLTGTRTVNPGSSYTITVGRGGIAPRGNGGNSSIVGVAAVNGGGGGGDATGTTGYTGGSSGGSSGAYVPVAPTPSDLSQGHIGSRGDNPACYTGGGGGGKSADGGVSSHAAGGAGAYSSITGVSVAYAGGGGGGGGYYGTTAGAGGSGIVIVRYLHP